MIQLIFCPFLMNSMLMMSWWRFLLRMMAQNEKMKIPFPLLPRFLLVFGGSDGESGTVTDLICQICKNIKII